MVQDILLTEDDDLKLRSDDLAVGDATAQNQKLILMTAPGEWKESPTVGVGLEGFLEDDTVDEMFKEIREQFRADGQKVKELKVLPSGHIGINAKYE